MAYFNPNVTTDIKARDTAAIPLAPGQFLMTSDTRSIFYDLEDRRIQLTDIIELDTEAQRQALIAPVNKFYFVKNPGTLWRYNNGEWIEWTKGSGGGNHAEHKVLTTAGWISGQQLVEIDGLTAEQNGFAGLSQDVSQAEFEAAANAGIRICGQTNGSITLGYYGDKPGCDIPITIIILD